jgi:hypothetical protein
LYSENTFTAELRKILTYKEGLLTDVKNMLYFHTDDVERLQKVAANTEEQFADCLRQIKTLGEEKERWQKELEDLRGAAKKLMDMVDPPEEGEVGERPLPERLLGVPQKVIKFLTEAQLEMFAQGVATECTEDQFNEYLREAQPVAEQIVKSVLQD